MEKLITYDTLRKFAYCNDKICEKPFRGIVLSFFGLGSSSMYSEDPEDGKFFAERGILYLVPYNNPWAWMNRQSVAYTDELIDVLFCHYSLPETTPVVSTGGSMGGQAALVYMVYAARTPVACVANCPVCDLPYHFTERDDLPRTLYSAFWHEAGTIQQALESASPVHLVDKMPDADYYIFHCEEDHAVNKQKHSDVFVAAMQQSHRIVYQSVPGRGHCDLPDDVRQLYRERAAQAVAR